MSIVFIEQTDPAREAWGNLTANVTRLPLTQSWAYAEAMASARGWLPTYYRIEGSGTVLGGCIVQRRHTGIANGIRIERGPFFTQQINLGQLTHVMEQLAAITKPGLLDRRRYYPDVPVESDGTIAIGKAGFKAVDHGYHTIWLDLTLPLAERRQGLRQNWRVALNKAGKSPIDIRVEHDATNLNWLIAHHVNAMRRQRYIGPTAALLSKLSELTVATNDFLMLRAVYLGKPIAGALFIRHGRSATYLIGWSGKVGRKYNAQHALLWRSIEVLAEQRVEHMDLGGLNPDRAAGVTYFKRGLLTANDREVISADICR